MVAVEAGRFTIGVFQDVAWAEKGIAALKQAGFVPESMTVLGKESVEAGALLMRTFGAGRGAAGTGRHRPRDSSGPAGRSASGRKPRSSKARAVSARCGASGFRRMTRASSKRLSAGAASLSPSAASLARPTPSPFCIPTAGGTPRSAPGSGGSDKGVGSLFGPAGPKKTPDPFLASLTVEDTSRPYADGSHQRI